MFASWVDSSAVADPCLSRSAVSCLTGLRFSVLRCRFAAFGAMVLLCLTKAIATEPTRSPAEIIAAAHPDEWREVDQEALIYLEIPAGRVVIELNSLFAPQHVSRIKQLIRSGYFTRSAIVRAQDNFVVQWSQPDKSQIPEKFDKLSAEFVRPRSIDLPFVPLPDPDTYAAEVGFTGGFPVARDPATGEAWLVHCYGMVGVARGLEADSGHGTSLYAVIGQAPRPLDRNLTLVGRVLKGMEFISTVPRGKGEQGFYESPAEQIPISRIVVAADLEPTEQLKVEVLRTDSDSFRALIAARRHPSGAFFQYPVDRIGLANISAPVRIKTREP